MLKTFYAKIAAVIILSFFLNAQLSGQSRPYDDALIELVYILGSLSHLETTCKNGSANTLEDMNLLLEAEQPSPSRRALLIDSYNNGFRSVASIHLICNDNTRILIEDLKKKASILAQKTSATYGQ
jgi:uncharacterized protein (TIGR02301 family)